MKKIAFSLFLLLNTSLVLAQDLNDYLYDRLIASWQCRQVDYEEMVDVVLNKKDSLDSYLRGLALVEILRSEGADSMTIKMIDKLFELYDDSRIADMREYLLDTKVRLLILENNYDEIGKTANYVAERWPDEQYGNIGVLGTPDLARFGYIELTEDSLIVKKQSHHEGVEPNFTMNPGTTGTKCICLPCICQGRPSRFILDTGSNSFLIPEGDKTSEIIAQVGGQNLEIVAGLYSHPLVEKHDAIGYWGLPILWALDRICLDFKHAHVDFIRKKGVNNILRLPSAIFQSPLSH